MNGMLLHCGSEAVTRQQVEAVPVPKHTRSWRPMSYGQMIEHCWEAAHQRLGLSVKSASYGLNKNGDQMFALLNLDTGSDEKCLSIGLRSSYNKTIAPAVAMGASVFVCDNLCFDGDAFKIVRKNTVNVWGDYKALINQNIGDATRHYDRMEEDTQRMKALPCNLRRGFSYLGVALGEGVLTPTQASVAFGDWKEARHEEFSDRNVWSLYNCVTEGLKKGPPARIMERHAKAHEFFKAVK